MSVSTHTSGRFAVTLGCPQSKAESLGRILQNREPLEHVRAGLCYAARSEAGYLPPRLGSTSAPPTGATALTMAVVQDAAVRFETAAIEFATTHGQQQRVEAEAVLNAARGSQHALDIAQHVLGGSAQAACPAAAPHSSRTACSLLQSTLHVTRLGFKQLAYLRTPY